MSLKNSQSESSLLYSQAKNLFEKAKIAIDSGTLRTETQLVNEIFSVFQEFFESIGRSNLTVRHAPENGPPWSEDYNDMMEEIKADLEMLYSEIELIGQTLYTDFNHNTVQYDTLNVRYNDVLDRMKDLELYSGVTKNTVQFANENFLNSDKIDFSRSSLTAADISNGVASLPVKSKVNISPQSQVSIITGNTELGKHIIGSSSNGFPGNNSEIHTVTDGILTTQKYTPTFLGDQNNHGGYASTIDNNANTWFEYEKVNVREHDKVTVAKNLGWTYQVDGSTMVEFIGEPTNGVLQLQVQIVLPEESVINQIFFNMYTPPNYGAKTAKIKDILVTDGRVPPYSIIPDGHTAEGYNYSFDPVSAKIVYALFEQPEKYATDIGHIYYEKTSASQRTGDYALGNEINSTKYAQRMAGPAISLSSLGVRVEKSNTKITAEYPLVSADDNRDAALSSIINDLSTSIEDKDADIGIEKFEGWRWCIGIRDIEIYSCEYEDEGEIVSKPFIFDKPVEKLTLEVGEILPTSVLEEYETKYNYLQYFVSIDDGGTWNPITPMSHEIISEDQPPKLYTVRTIGTDSMKLTNKNAYLESEAPVYSIRVKIVVKKPEVFSSFSSEHVDNMKNRISPVLEHYTLSVTTEGDISDSKESLKIINATDIGTSIGENPTPTPVPPIPPTIPPDPTNPPGLPSTDCDPSDPFGGCYQGPPPVDNCDPDDPTSKCYVEPDEGGESNGGSDKIDINIFDNPFERKKFCLGETYIIEGDYWGDNDIDRLEFYFNGILIEVQEIFNVYGPKKSGKYEITITSELLAKYFTATTRGTNFMFKAYAYDVMGNKRKEEMRSKFLDCTDEEEASKIKLKVDSFKKKLCNCNDLIITGLAESQYLIDPESVRIEINNQIFDYKEIGLPITNPCDPSPEPDELPEIPDEDAPPLEVDEPEVEEPEVEEEILDEINLMSLISIIRDGVVDNQVCYPQWENSLTMPVRIISNHPLKNLVFYIDGTIVATKEYAFDEMVFDDIIDIQVNGIYNYDSKTLMNIGEVYFGNENRTIKFGFDHFQMNFIEAETCPDHAAEITGPAKFGPSDYYNNLSRYYVDVPYYALGGQEPDYEMATMISIKPEKEEMLSIKSNTNKIDFTMNIPYWKLLELGCVPEGRYKVKIYASDTEKEVSKTYYINMADCEGEPRDEDEIEWNKEEITCLVCECADLKIKGYFTSMQEILSTDFIINGIKINPDSLGLPGHNPCGNQAEFRMLTNDQEFKIMSNDVIKKEYDIIIPYWKLLELGCVPNGEYILKVKGEGLDSKTTSSYKFKVRNDCLPGVSALADCSVCENDNCVKEDEEETTLKLRISEFEGKPCECEDVRVKGYVKSEGSPINELTVTINGVEFNPNDLGPVFPSICGGEVPPVNPPVEPVDPVNPPVAPPSNSDIIKFLNPSHSSICDNLNTFNTEIQIITPSAMKKVFLTWTSNGEEVLHQEVTGVEGAGQVSFEMGFPIYNVPIDGTTKEVARYFEAGQAELKIEVRYGTEVEVATYPLTITSCSNVKASPNYKNGLTQPNVDISFLDEMTYYPTSYWHGVHAPYSNISDDYWQGRNDWLDLMGVADVKINAAEPFWTQLFKLFKEYISVDQLQLPEPFSEFDKWWKSNMSRYNGDSKVDIATRGSVYATYKLKQFAIIYPGTEKEMAILIDGKLEELSKFITLAPRYTYHWIDFKDIESDGGTLAWVQSLNKDFLAYMNIEEAVFDAGVHSLNAHRHKNYTINSGQDFGAANIYNNVDAKHNKFNALIGDSSFEQLLFTRQEAVGLLVGGETVVHEVAHAISYYAEDAYPNKYIGEGRAFHDWDEWRNISEWPLFVDKATDDATIPYTSSNGLATSKFSKTSSVSNKLSTGKEAPVSPYGCRHPAEDFAEAYAIYKINPNLLKDLYSKKYEFMETWIKNMPRSADRLTVFNTMNNTTFTMTNSKKIEHVCDCGMRAKREKVVPTVSLKKFHYEILPPTMHYEFDWTIPYWKLLQLGCVLGKSYTLRIRAFTEDGEKKRTTVRRVSLKDCNAGPDEKPYDDACHTTESVMIHYYDEAEQDIKQETIPVELLPYQISNGAGTIARICLRDRSPKGGVSVEVIESGDESGHAFQLHAAGVNYYQFGNTSDIRTVWASKVFSKAYMSNKALTIGDPSTRSIPWLEEVRSGNYENAPSLEKKGSRIRLTMPKEYKLHKCNDDISCGKVVRPEPTGKDCNEATHFIIQYYSIQSRGLRVTKIPINHKKSVAGKYQLDEKTAIIVKWDSELEGIVIKVDKAENNKSVIITAAGIISIKPNGISETKWSETLRFYSANAKRPELILGELKRMSNLSFISGSTINYDKASYIGGVGDFVIVKLNEAVTKKFCNMPTQPTINIPEDMIRPSVNFENLLICAGGGVQSYQFKVKDYTAIRDVVYTVSANGVNVINNVRASFSSNNKEETVTFELDVSGLDEGDTVKIKALVRNTLGGEKEAEKVYTVAYCDESPPEIIEFSPALPMNEDGSYCYGDLASGNFLPVNIHAIDDRSIGRIQVSVNGENALTENLSTNPLVPSTEGMIRDIPITLPEPEITSTESSTLMTKSDIIFIFDTSVSMDGDIGNVRNNLNVFKETLKSKNIDAHFGYIDSNHEHSNMQMNLVPSESFNLDAVTDNKGEWETLKWKQFTDPVHGGMYFLNQFRPGADRVFIAVSDVGISGELTEDIISQMVDNDITVHFIVRNSTSYGKYVELMARTGGQRFDLESKNFGEEMSSLAETIIGETTSYTPDAEYTLVLTVTDLAGNTDTEEFTITVTDCEFEQPGSIDPPETPDPIDPPPSTNQLASVTINERGRNLNVGSDLNYTAQVISLADGSARQIGSEGTWSVVNSNIATLSGNRATGVAQGNTSIRVDYMGLTDTTPLYVLQPPTHGGTDEGVIENDYKILARLKWGKTPEDVDIYAYVDRDISRKIWFASSPDRTDSTNLSKKYYDEDGEMYLNRDWATHKEDSDFDTEYEVITINGFKNKGITFILDRRSRLNAIDPNYPPTLELIDREKGQVIYKKATTVAEWGESQHLRVCEIQLNGSGNYGGILRHSSPIIKDDPTL